MNHTIYEQTEIQTINLKNRVIRSATHEGMADDRGLPTDQLKKLYVRLARGGVGAIITGYAGVQQDGKSPQYRMTMIDGEDCIEAWKEVTDAVHENGTPIILQIAHCGRQTRSKITGLPTVAPSAIRDRFYNEDIPAELTESEIEIIINNFVSAIVRAQQAGFDGVQLHLAHGYLLCQFLSSYYNHRKDEWGGSTENKYRIVGEIIKRAKTFVGDFPILVKMNAYDGRKNGMSVDEAVIIAEKLESSGCAAIEISCGVIEDGLFIMRGEKLPAEAAMSHGFKYKKLPSFVKTIMTPLLKTFLAQPKPLKNYNLEAALTIQSKVSIPVIVVGGIDNIADIDSIITERGIPFVSMSRPFIIEPNIVSKFQNGKQTRSKCIKCNFCALIGEEQALRCYYGKLPKKS